MSTWLWIIVVLVAASAAFECGYRNGRRDGLRLLGSATRQALRSLLWPRDDAR